MPKALLPEGKRPDVGLRVQVNGRAVCAATPPLPLCPLGPLSCQGSIATGHTHGGAKGAQIFFFIPLAHVAPIPAQAMERGWEAPPLAHVAPLPTKVRVRGRVTNPNQD